MPPVPTSNRERSRLRHCCADGAPRTEAPERGPMKAIRGKRALVTGAASGIGRAISLALAREGADLYLLDVDEENLASVVAEAEPYGTRVVGRGCDLARPDSIQAAVQALLQSWGYLDILVNNAGVSYHGKTE